MADKQTKVVTTQCPSPEVEGRSGKVKQTRTMKMGVTPLKGQPVQEHEYVREDY